MSFGGGRISTTKDAAAPDDGGSNSNNISPTSVMLPPSIDNIISPHKRGSTGSHAGSQSHAATNNNNTDMIINQLKRQVTTLEHEKASLEQELLNQINTVVYDKENMVSTLQEKLVASEARYKEERKAHTATRSSVRQTKFANVGDAKLEIFRLQDQVTELTEANEQLQATIAQLQADNAKSEQALKSQFTLMEKNSQAQMEVMKKETTSQLNDMEQSHLATIADMERQLFERYQSKLKEVQKQVEEAKRKEDSGTKDEQEVKYQEMIEELQKTNSDLLRQVSDLGSQLVQEQTINYDLQAELDQAKCAPVEDASAKQMEAEFQAELATLHEKLLQSETKQENLVKSLQEQEKANQELQQSLDEVQKAEESILSQLQKKSTQVESLQAALEKTHHDNKDAVLDLQNKCKEYTDDIRSFNEQLEHEIINSQKLMKELTDKDAKLRALEEAQEKNCTTMANLQDENNRYSEEIQTLKAQLETETGLNAAIQEELRMNKDLCTKLEDTQKAEINAMRQQLAQEQDVNACLKQSLEELQHSTSQDCNVDTPPNVPIASEALTIKVESLRRQIDERDASHAELKTQLESSQNENKELRKLQKQNEDWITLLQDQNNKSAALTSTLAGEVEDAKVTLKEYKDEISKLECQVQELSDELVDEQTTTSELLNSLREEENANSVLQEKYQLTTDAINDLKYQLREQKQAVQELQSSLKDEERKNNELETLAEERYEEVTRLQEETSCLLDRIESLEEQLGDEQEMIQELQSLLEEKESLIIINTEEQELTDKELLSLEKEHGALKAEIISLRNEMEHDREFTRKANATMTADFQKDRLGLLDRIGSLKEELDEMKLLNSSLERALANSKSTMADLQANHDEKGEVIRAKDEEIAMLHSKERQLLVEATKNFALLNIVKASLLGSQRVNEDLESRYAVLLSRFEMQSIQLEAEQSSNENMTAVIEELTEDFASAKTNADAKLSSLEEEQEILKGTLSSVNALLNSAECTKKSLRSCLDEKDNVNQLLLIMLEYQRDAITAHESSYGDIMSQLRDTADELERLKTLREESSADMVITPRSPMGETDTEYTRTLSGPESDFDDSGCDDPEKKFDALYHKTEMASLQEQNLELRRELDNLSTVRAILTDLEKEKVSLLDEITSLHDKLTQKETNQSDAISSLEEQQMESILQATFEDQTSKDDAIEELRRQRDTLNNDLKKIQSELQNAKETSNQLANKQLMDSEELEQLKVDLESEKSQKKKIEADYHTAKEGTKKLQDDILDKKRVIDNLEEQLAKHKMESAEEIRLKEAELQAAIQELRDTKDWLEKSLDEVEDLRGKLLNSASSLQKMDESQNETILKLETELKELREKLKESCVLFQNKEEKNQDMELQIEQLESDLSDTKQTLSINLQELERLQSIEMKSEDTRKVLDSFKSAAEHWRTEADRLKTAKDELVTKQMEREAKLKAAYKREISSYKDRVEEFEGKLLTENVKLRNQLDEAEKSILTKETEIKTLSADFECARRLASENKKDKKELQEKIGVLQSRLKEFEADRKVLDANQKDKKELQEKVRNLQERIGDFEADRLEKQMLDIEEQKEINKLKVELAVEKQAVDDCRKEIKHLHTKSEELQRKCTEALSRAEAFEGKAKEGEEYRQVLERSVSASQVSLKQEVEVLKKELRRTQGEKVELEARYMDKLLAMEGKHSALSIELAEKKREINSMRRFFRDGGGADKSAEDLQIEIKELTEKTIVQNRIIHTMQKKIESLEQGKEKFFYEKRKEIMRDHSEQQSLRKENTRLREKLKAVIKERRALQAQLESFANSIGTSMGSHLRKDEAR